MYSPLTVLNYPHDDGKNPSDPRYRSLTTIAIMGSDKVTAEGASRLVPKMIAVFAELDSSLLTGMATAAITAGHSTFAAVALGGCAALLTVKNWAQGVTSKEAQSAATEQLAALVRQQGSLRKALDEIAVNQDLQEIFSRERASELKQLLQLEQDQVEARIAEHQEITFCLARFMERWCNEHSISLETLTRSVGQDLNRIKNTIQDGFDQVKAKLDFTNEFLARVSPSITAARIQPDTAPPPNTEVQVPAASNSINPPATADDLAERFLRASQTVLNWDSKLGSGRHRIPAGLESEILKDLEQEPSTTLILGPKGCGKSSLLAIIAEEVINRGWNLLALRADRLQTTVKSPTDLAASVINCPMDIGDAIRLVAKRQKTIVIIDQLDSVSEITDRRSERLNVLLNLVRDLSQAVNIHIVAACREFDHGHDSRLTTLDAKTVRLPLPPWEEIAKILEFEGHRTAGLSASMRELLRVPWHLNLYLRAARTGEEFQSLQSLIEEVWKKSVLGGDGSQGRVNLVESIALRMSDEEEAFVPSSIADKFPEARDSLLREDILVEQLDGRALAFRHQTFYDHVLSRLFSSGENLLATHVLEHQDGLFVRPTLLTGLEYLRATAPNSYHRQVLQILDSNPRRHIRTLLLEFLASQADPNDTEASIIFPRLETDDGPLILSAAAGSREWFKRLQGSGALARYMHNPPEKAAMCLNLLINASAFDSESVYRLVAGEWLQHQQYDKLLFAVASNFAGTWDERWVSLICTACRRTGLGGIYLAEHIASTLPTGALRIVRACLDHELERADQLAREDNAPLPGDTGDEVKAYLRRLRSPHAALISRYEDSRYGLEEIAEKCPKEFVEAIWPWFEAVISNCMDKSRESFVLYRDDCATAMAYGEMRPIIVTSIHIASNKWASIDPDGFISFAKGAEKVEGLWAHRILSQAFYSMVDRNPKGPFDYLTGDRRRMCIGTHRDSLSFSTKLISALFPRLSSELRNTLEAMIATFDTYTKEDYARMDQKTRFKAKKWSREDRLRLLEAIPEECLSESMLRLKQDEGNSLRRRFRPRMSDSGLCSLVGPRLSADELTKVSNENIMNLIDELASSDQQRRHRLPVGRSGGSREQAAAVGGLVMQHPERAAAILNQLHPDRTDQHLYAAEIIKGLVQSAFSATTICDIIVQLDSRGFRSGDFRERCAWAVEEILKRHAHVTPEVAQLLEGWIDDVQAPEWPEDAGPSVVGRHNGALVFGHDTKMFTLMNGRAAIFRAFVAVCSSGSKVDAQSIVRALQSRASKEPHPRVAAELLMYGHNGFTDKLCMSAATAAYDSIIQHCPAALDCDAAIHALAALTGYFKPPELYENWLMMLSVSSNDESRQAYGELLFLYYARTLSNWAENKIKNAIAAGDQSISMGLFYASADSWQFPDCRPLATDILCVAATREGSEQVARIVESAFIPGTDGEFHFDDHARRLIGKVCESPQTLKACAAQIIEVLVSMTGTIPELVLKVCESALQSFGSQVNQMSGRVSDMARDLTIIAITLHRHPLYRLRALELFEKLLELGVREAAAALAVLDRKPYGPPQETAPRYRMRRRRNK